MKTPQNPLEHKKILMIVYKVFIWTDLRPISTKGLLGKFLEPNLFETSKLDISEFGP